MTPRPARLWHVPALTGILWSFSRTTDWLPQVRSPGADLRSMARAVNRGWVRLIADKSGPAGFIARDGVRVHALYVHPRARGRGIGQHLLTEAKTRSPRLELWTPQINHPARAFYHRQGFTELARTAGDGNDEALPDICLVWQRKEA